MTAITVALTVALILAGSRASAQHMEVRGLVSDSASGAPLAHVRAEWYDLVRRRAMAAYTDANGRFTLELARGQYEVLFGRLGYAALRINVAIAGASDSLLSVVLAARGVPLDPIVVSVSRREQPRIDAPAAISVIDREAIARDIRLDPLDQIRTLPGIDFASKGLIQNTFGARGARTPSARSLLLLTDNRYAEVPAIVSVSFLRPATREDIERIEVVRGPTAALYGPGAPQGVVHIITRSPFESRGGTAALTIGTRNIWQATARYAERLRPQLAMSISADHLQGDDWPAVDSVEIDNRSAAIARGAAVDTLRIARRDDTIRRASSEARLDWRPGPRTELMMKAGVAQAANAIDLSGLGALQLRNWRSWYAQARLQHNALTLNSAVGANDAGDTYYLRTGAPLVEESRMFALQAQHGRYWRGVDFVYGVDLRIVDPRTRGTVHGVYEHDDVIRETGLYVQSTATVGSRLQMVTALRVDDHSRMQDMVLSPRAALLYKPGHSHALRLTYNRAFNSPHPNELFLDTRVNTLPGYPYEIRQHRVPPGGMTFARDCNGLCMRSPFAGAGLDARLPADATLLWAEMVALLAQRGINIADIPAPASAAVSTVLAIRNQGTRTFEPVTPAHVRDLPPLRRQITNALELGYRGTLPGGQTFTADLHATRVHDRLVGSAIAVTPNVFFDRHTLEQYLNQYRDAEAALQIASALAQVPVGIVTPIESPYATDILLIGRQGQSYTLWGIDLSAELPLGSLASVTGTYSWSSYDTTSASMPDVPVVLVIPKHKAAVEAAVHNVVPNLRASARVRGVAPFRQRGLFRDPTAPAYGVMDISASYRWPRINRMSTAAEVRNVLAHAHREYPGGAVIGRLAVLRMRVEF